MKIINSCQKHTSAKTSIANGRKSSAYNFVIKNKGKDTVVFDYGCGRYDYNNVYCVERGIKWLGYDPFNRDTFFNNYNISIFEATRTIDYIICSNVLNIIDNLVDITNIIEQICSLSKSKSAKVIFSFYEGDKSGRGKETKKDCWQRNETLSIWQHRIERYFKVLERKGTCLVCLPK